MPYGIVTAMYEYLHRLLLCLEKNSKCGDIFAAEASIMVNAPVTGYYFSARGYRHITCSYCCTRRNGDIGNCYGCRSYVCAVDRNTAAAKRRNANTITKLVSVPVMVTLRVAPCFAVAGATPSQAGVVTKILSTAIVYGGGVPK